MEPRVPSGRLNVRVGRVHRAWPSLLVAAASGGAARAVLAQRTSPRSRASRPAGRRSTARGQSARFGAPVLRCPGRPLGVVHEDWSARRSRLASVDPGERSPGVRARTCPTRPRRRCRPGSASTGPPSLVCDVNKWAAHPTRLETRTKESSMRASRREPLDPKAY